MTPVAFEAPFDVGLRVSSPVTPRARVLPLAVSKLFGILDAPALAFLHHDDPIQTAPHQAAVGIRRLQNGSDQGDVRCLQLLKGSQDVQLVVVVTRFPDGIDEKLATQLALVLRGARSLHAAASGPGAPRSHPSGGVVGHFAFEIVQANGNVLEE